ncbi:MAG TPA: hypothetical protein VNG12_12895 [Acidimicrobiales bacterium]|nr:hypothetical protein [Acidimicrobiales bacterium]
MGGLRPLFLLSRQRRSQPYRHAGINGLATLGLPLWTRPALGIMLHIEMHLTGRLK